MIELIIKHEIKKDEIKIFKILKVIINFYINFYFYNFT